MLGSHLGHMLGSQHALGGALATLLPVLLPRTDPDSMLEFIGDLAAWNRPAGGISGGGGAAAAAERPPPWGCEYRCSIFRGCMEEVWLSLELSTLIANSSRRRVLAQGGVWLPFGAVRRLCGLELLGVGGVWSSFAQGQLLQGPAASPCACTQSALAPACAQTWVAPKRLFIHTHVMVWIKEGSHFAGASGCRTTICSTIRGRAASSPPPACWPAVQLFQTSCW